MDSKISYDREHSEHLNTKRNTFKIEYKTSRKAILGNNIREHFYKGKAEGQSTSGQRLAAAIPNPAKPFVKLDHIMLFHVPVPYTKCTTFR